MATTTVHDWTISFLGRLAERIGHEASRQRNGTYVKLHKIAVPEIEIVNWPIESLIPSARNARTHSDARVA